MKTLRFYLIFLLPFFLPLILRAEVPPEIGYQGRLTDESGVPLNGRVQMTFRIYDAPTGGNLLFEQKLGEVPISNGVYHVSFGANGEEEQGTRLLTELGGEPELYLAPLFEGVEVEKRTRLLAVPFALQARTSEEAQVLAGKVTALQNRLDASGIGSGLLTISGEISFGPAVVGAAISRKIQLRNEGTEPVTITDILTPERFTTDWATGTIPAGATKVVTVSFSPNEVGTFFGDMVLSSDSPRGEQVLPLRGVGILAPENFTFVPFGSFAMGDAFGEGAEDEFPVHPVTVSGFFIGQTEVSNEEVVSVFNWALNEGLIEVAESEVRNLIGDPQTLLDLASEDGEIFWNGTELEEMAGKELHPCVEISWYGAMAFCHLLNRIEAREQAVDLADWEADLAAKGYRLPTEAEWEKAARGGTEGQRYPFGNEISHEFANYAANGSVFPYDLSPYINSTFHPDWDDGDIPHTSPAKTFSANARGLYDVTGNVYEWCLDWYLPEFYNESSSLNPTGPSFGTGRILRGGSWNSSAEQCRVSARFVQEASATTNFIGFRPVLSE